MTLGLVSCTPQRLVQFGSGECSTQPIHHRSRPIVLQAFFLQLAQKDIPGKSGSVLAVWCAHLARRMVYLDRVIASDDSTENPNRGNVTLADSSQGQDEAQIY